MRRHDPGPDAPPQAFVLQIPPILARAPRPDLGARARDLHAQDAGALQLRGVGVARVLPAGRHEGGGDELQRVQALGGVGHEVGVPEDDGGAVVAAVVVGGEGEDDAVELCGGDADGDAAVWCVGVVGGWGETDEAGGCGAVEVEYSAVAFVRESGVWVGARAADHGQDYGEGWGVVVVGSGGGEGDMEDGGFVDDGVDGLVVVFAWDR